MDKPGRDRQSLGRRGEDAAVSYLTGLGWGVVDRNWRCRQGELDIVALEPAPCGDTLVFIEVKTRSGLGYGHPLEALTPLKIQHFKRSAMAWIDSHHDDMRGCYTRIRLDGLGIVCQRGHRDTIDHVRGLS